MKKFAVMIATLLVAGLWFMPAQRVDAQTELERVESEIRGLEALAGMCIGELNQIIPPGPSASAEQLAAFEKLLSSVEQCLANIEKRMEWLQKRLGELISKLPSATAPGEDPKRKMQREEIEDWKKRLAAAEEKRNQIRARFEKLLKTTRTKQPAPGFNAETTSTGILSTTTLTTPQGRIVVHLPADVRPGDTISGTVNVEPNGQTEEERAKNLAGLNLYQLKIANEIVPGPWGEFTWFSTRGLVGLHNSGGREETAASGSNVQLPMEFLLPIGIGDQKGKGQRHTIQAPVEWGLQWAIGESKSDQVTPPLVAQNGRPAKVTGSFDGNLGTTRITIGGQPATMLAESPRSCIWKSPEQPLGPTEIIVKENNVVTKGTYRNLGLRLHALKTSLLKGETTVLTVIVEGLKGIRQNVPLLLEKLGVVSLEGGDPQTVQIRPTDVRADGTFELKRTLTGLQAGNFGVTATVVDPALRPIIIPLIENGGVNGYRVKKDGTGFVINVENVKHPITGDPVDGQHKLEHQCPTLSKIPYVSNLFLNKGNGKTDGRCLTIMITPRIIIQNEN